jgi:hypothetical protein
MAEVGLVKTALLEVTLLAVAFVEVSSLAEATLAYEALLPWPHFLGGTISMVEVVAGGGRPRFTRSDLLDERVKMEAVEEAGSEEEEPKLSR